MNPFRAVAAFFRRWLSRRAARRLAAQALPRGLPPPARPFGTALREPPPFEAPPGELWTLPLGAQLIRGRAPARLLRLSALPPLPHALGVARPHGFRVLAPPLRLPLAPLRTLEPRESMVRSLGVAEPRRFRLDEALTLPVERDPLRLAADAPAPVKTRRVRPRAPLGRAPLARLRLRDFRLDREGLTQNEGVIAPRGDLSFWWVRPSFRRERLDLPWMARERIAFLGPLQVEWFADWWEQMAARKPGGRDPVSYELPQELQDAIENVKEQMLIRRDVAKDETGVAAGEFFYVEQGHPIVAHDPVPLAALMPEKEWIEVAQIAMEPVPLEPFVREAYLQWRTLVDALEER